MLWGQMGEGGGDKIVLNQFFFSKQKPVKNGRLGNTSRYFVDTQLRLDDEFGSGIDSLFNHAGLVYILLQYRYKQQRILFPKVLIILAFAQPSSGFHAVQDPVWYVLTSSLSRQQPWRPRCPKMMSAAPCHQIFLGK